MSFPARVFRENYVPFGRTTDFDSVRSIPTVMIHAADVIFKEIQKRNWTQGKAAAQITEAGRRIGFPDYEMDRTRLCKLLGNRHGYDPRKKARAQAFQTGDLPAIANCFAVTQEELTGCASPPDIVTVDTPRDRSLWQEFAALYRRNREHAKEVLGWGETIPCSLVPDSFMVCEHKSRFAELYDDRKFDSIVDQYNNIGRLNRESFLQQGITRAWEFTHIMFESHLARLSNPEADEYKCCGHDERIECLESLRQLASDPVWKVNVAVVDDRYSTENIKALKRKLRSFDTYVVLLGDNNAPMFGFWRDYSGLVSFTRAPAKLSDMATHLEQLRQASNFASTDRTAAMREWLDGQIDELRRLAEG